MRLIIFFSLIVSIFLNCFFRKEINLSSPEATINTYCSTRNKEVIQQCFYPGIKIEKGIYKRIWTEYRIIEKKQPQNIGQEFPLGVNNIFYRVSKDDVEIIIEAKMIDPQKGNPWTKFWFLLRKFNDEWKILDNYHIPDNYYPPHD